MQRYTSRPSLHVILFAAAILFSILDVKTEECGVINTDLLRNSDKITRIDEFPWMANVAFNISDKDKDIFGTPFLCQAVLISQRHLLVIAKCIDRKNDNFQPYAVLLGESNPSKDYIEKNNVDGIFSLLINIDQIIIHPYYNTLRRANDIAMLRLTESVTFTPFVRPICLPTKDIANKEFGSEELKLTGWFRHLGPRQKMSIFAYNQHDCRRKFLAFDNFNITDKHLCGIAGDVEMHFSSGAALMDVRDKESHGSHNNAYLVGLLSYRFVSFYKRDQIVFIRIDRFMDWIEQNMF